MFTGIISHTGKLKKAQDSIFTFLAPKSFCKCIGKGTSIAINGVCLTMAYKLNLDSFSVEIMPETLKRSMFGKLKINDLVNLELPVTLNTLLSGHIVQGHVDGIGKIEEVKKEGESKILKISISKNLDKYIVEKGSIAVNGVSLTVIETTSLYFTVGIIPYTWDHTMLCQIKIGDLVNLEVDILAKYVESLTNKKYE